MYTNVLVQSRTVLLKTGRLHSLNFAANYRGDRSRICSAYRAGFQRQDLVVLMGSGIFVPNFSGSCLQIWAILLDQSSGYGLKYPIAGEDKRTVTFKSISCLHKVLADINDFEGRQLKADCMCTVGCFNEVQQLPCCRWC